MQKSTASLILQVIQFASSDTEVKALLAARDANSAVACERIYARVAKRDPDNSNVAAYDVFFDFATKTPDLEVNDDMVVRVAVATGASTTMKIINRKTE